MIWHDIEKKAYFQSGSGFQDGFGQETRDSFWLVERVVFFNPWSVKNCQYKVEYSICIIPTMGIIYGEQKIAHGVESWQELNYQILSSFFLFFSFFTFSNWTLILFWESFQKEVWKLISSNSTLPLAPARGNSVKN